MLLTEILAQLDQKDMSDAEISFNVNKLNALLNPYPELVIALQVQKVFEWFDYENLNQQFEHGTLTKVLKMNAFLSNEPNSLPINDASTRIKKKFSQMQPDQTLILYNNNKAQILNRILWHDLIQNLITTLLVTKSV